MPDHREFVAQLAPLDVWSEDGRCLAGNQWGGRTRAPILEPLTRDVVGRIDRIAVTVAGLVGVGVLDPTGVYLARSGHVLEPQLAPGACLRRIHGGIQYTDGMVASACLGLMPAWPDVWLRLDEQPCRTCTTPTGYAHATWCTVARCLATGLQRATCYADHDHGGDTWAGEFPGWADAREFGWYARPTPSGWTPCAADAPGAVPDLNRLMTEATWSEQAGRWVR